MCSTFAGTIALISNILEIFSFRDLNLLFFWSQGHEVAAKVSDFCLMWSAQPYAQACGLLGDGVDAAGMVIVRFFCLNIPRQILLEIWILRMIHEFWDVSANAVEDNHDK